MPGVYSSWADDVVAASTGTAGEPKPEDELDAASAKYVLKCGAATGELVAVDSDSDSDSEMGGSSDVDTGSEMSSGGRGAEQLRPESPPSLAFLFLLVLLVLVYFIFKLTRNMERKRCGGSVCRASR